MVDSVAAASGNALAAAGVNRAGGNGGFNQNTARQPSSQAATAQQNSNTRQTSATQGASASQRSSGIGSQNKLTEAQRERVQELQQRDREVRQHERAHQVAGGSVAGSAQFSYTQGPDGQRYATSGEVSIDTSTEDDPRETIAKMQTVIRAALAPAEPSSQDQKVAAQARAQLAQAQQELNRQQASGGGQQGPLDGNGITIAQNEGSRAPSQPGNQRAGVQAFEQARALGSEQASELIRTTA